MNIPNSKRFRKENKVKIIALFIIYVFLGSMFSGVGMVAADECTDYSSRDCIDKINSAEAMGQLNDAQVKQLLESDIQKSQYLSPEQLNNIDDIGMVRKIIVYDKTKASQLSDDNVMKIDWTSTDMKDAKPNLRAGQIRAALDNDPAKVGDLGELNPLEAVSAVKQKFGLGSNVALTIATGVHLSKDGFLFNKGYCSEKNIKDDDCLKLNLKSGIDKTNPVIISAVSPDESSSDSFPGFVFCDSKNNNCKIVAGEISQIRLDINGKVIVSYTDSEGKNKEYLLDSGETAVVKDKDGKAVSILSEGAELTVGNWKIKVHGASSSETKLIFETNGFRIDGAAEFSSEKDHISLTQFGGESRFVFDSAEKLKSISADKAEIDYYGNTFNGEVGLYFDGNMLMEYTLGPNSRSMLKDVNGKFKETVVPPGETLRLINDGSRLQKVRDYQLEIAVLQKNCNDDAKECKYLAANIEELYSKIDSALKDGTGYFSMKDGVASGYQTMKTGGGVEYVGYEKDGKTVEFSMKGVADNTVFSYFEPKRSYKNQELLNGIIYFSNSFEDVNGDIGTATIRYDLKSGDNEGSANLQFRFTKEKGVTSARVKLDSLLGDASLLNSVITNNPNIGIAFLSDKPGNVVFFGADREGLYASFGNEEKGAEIGLTSGLEAKIRALKIETEYLKKTNKELDLSALSAEKQQQMIKLLSPVDKQILEAMKSYDAGKAEDSLNLLRDSLKSLDPEKDKEAIAKLTIALTELLNKEKISKTDSAAKDKINEEISNAFDSILNFYDEQNKAKLLSQKATTLCSGSENYLSCIYDKDWLTTDAKDAIRADYLEKQKINLLVPVFNQQLAAGNYEEALKVANEILNANKQIGNELLVSYYQSRGEYDKASEHNAKARELYAGDVESKGMSIDIGSFISKITQFSLAQAGLDFAREDYSSAKMNAENVLIYDKSNIHAQKVIGNSLYKERKFDEGIEKWEKFIEDNSQFGYDSILQEAMKERGILAEGRAYELLSSGKTIEALDYTDKLNEGSDMKTYLKSIQNSEYKTAIIRDLKNIEDSTAKIAQKKDEINRLKEIERWKDSGGDTSPQSETQKKIKQLEEEIKKLENDRSLSQNQININLLQGKIDSGTATTEEKKDYNQLVNSRNEFYKSVALQKAQELEGKGKFAEAKEVIDAERKRGVKLNNEEQSYYNKISAFSQFESLKKTAEQAISGDAEALKKVNNDPLMKEIKLKNGQNMQEYVQETITKRQTFSEIENLANSKDYAKLKEKVLDAVSKTKDPQTKSDLIKYLQSIVPESELNKETTVQLKTKEEANAYILAALSGQRVVLGNHKDKLNMQWSNYFEEGSDTSLWGLTKIIFTQAAAKSIEALTGKTGERFDEARKVIDETDKDLFAMSYAETLAKKGVNLQSATYQDVLKAYGGNEKSAKFAYSQLANLRVSDAWQSIKTEVNEGGYQVSVKALDLQKYGDAAPKENAILRVLAPNALEAGGMMLGSAAIGRIVQYVSKSAPVLQGYFASKAATSGSKISNVMWTAGEKTVAGARFTGTAVQETVARPFKWSNELEQTFGNYVEKNLISKIGTETAFSKAATWTAQTSTNIIKFEVFELGVEEVGYSRLYGVGKKVLGESGESLGDVVEAVAGGKTKVGLGIAGGITTLFTQDGPTNYVSTRENLDAVKTRLATSNPDYEIVEEKNENKWGNTEALVVKNNNDGSEFLVTLKDSNYEKSLLKGTPALASKGEIVTTQSGAVIPVYRVKPDTDLKVVVESLKNKQDDLESTSEPNNYGQIGGITSTDIGISFTEGKQQKIILKEGESITDLSQVSGATGPVELTTIKDSLESAIKENLRSDNPSVVLSSAVDRMKPGIWDTLNSYNIGSLSATPFKSFSKNHNIKQLSDEVANGLSNGASPVEGLAKLKELGLVDENLKPTVDSPVISDFVVKSKSALADADPKQDLIQKLDLQLNSFQKENEALSFLRTDWGENVNLDQLDKEINSAYLDTLKKMKKDGLETEKASKFIDYLIDINNQKSDSLKNTKDIIDLALKTPPESLEGKIDIKADESSANEPSLPAATSADKLTLIISAYPELNGIISISDGVAYATEPDKVDWYFAQQKIKNDAQKEGKTKTEIEELLSDEQKIHGAAYGIFTDPAYLNNLEGKLSDFAAAVEDGKKLAADAAAPTANLPQQTQINQKWSGVIADFNLEGTATFDPSYGTELESIMDYPEFAGKVVKNLGDGKKETSYENVFAEVEKMMSKNADEGGLGLWGAQIEGDVEFIFAQYVASDIYDMLNPLATTSPPTVPSTTTPPTTTPSATTPAVTTPASNSPSTTTPATTPVVNPTIMNPPTTKPPTTSGTPTQHSAQSIPVSSADNSVGQKQSLNHYKGLASRANLESEAEFESSIDAVIDALLKETNVLGNKAKLDDNGIVINNGIVELKNKNIPTVFVQDLHARRDAFLRLLQTESSSGETYFDLMKKGQLNIIVLGDALHSEDINNWISEAGKDKIGDEIVRSFNTIKMVMDLKAAFPDNFHYIRGNHDSVEDTSIGKGHTPQSRPVYDWLNKNFGPDFIQQYSKFEKSLPYMIKGNDFIASHSVPLNYYSIKEIVEANKYIDTSKGTEAEDYNNENIATEITWNRKGINKMDDTNSFNTNAVSTLDKLKVSKWIVGHTIVPGGKKEIPLYKNFLGSTKKSITVINGNEIVDGKAKLVRHSIPAKPPGLLSGLLNQRGSIAFGANPVVAPAYLAGKLLGKVFGKSADVSSSQELPADADEAAYSVDEPLGPEEQKLEDTITDIIRNALPADISNMIYDGGLMAEAAGYVSTPSEDGAALFEKINGLIGAEKGAAVKIQLDKMRPTALILSDTLNDLSNAEGRSFTSDDGKSRVWSESDSVLVQAAIERSAAMLLAYDMANPLPGYHDTVYHCLGNVRPAINMLIAAGASSKTVRLAAIAQMFHDLGYGQKVEADGEKFTTRLGTNGIMHEDRSILQAEKLLNQLGLTKEEKTAVRFMIAATKFASLPEDIAKGTLLWSGQTISADHDERDITSIAGIDHAETIMAAKALATVDVYKTENPERFEEATANLRTEFLGDILFGIRNRHLYADGKLKAEYDTIKRAYDNYPSLTVKELSDAISNVKAYALEDDKGNSIKPFASEAVAATDAQQIAGTAGFVQFAAQPRIAKLDMTRHLDTFYGSAQDNPFAASYEENMRTIKAYSDAITEVNNDNAALAPDTMTVDKFDSLVLDKLSEGRKGLKSESVGEYSSDIVTGALNPEIVQSGTTQPNIIQRARATAVAAAIIPIMASTFFFAPVDALAKSARHAADEIPKKTYVTASYTPATPSKSKGALWQLPAAIKNMFTKDPDKKVINTIPVPTTQMATDRTIASSALKDLDNNLGILKKDRSYWLPEVFTPEFMLAQEYQESRGDPYLISPDGKSSAGAVGVTQLMPVAVKAVFKDLLSNDELRQKHPEFAKLPKQLTDPQIQLVLESIHPLPTDSEQVKIEKAKKARILRDYYFMVILKSRDQKNLIERFAKSGKIVRAQGIALSYYNWGDVTSYNRLPAETKKYITYTSLYSSEIKRSRAKYGSPVYDYNDLLTNSPYLPLLKKTNAALGTKKTSQLKRVYSSLLKSESRTVNSKIEFDRLRIIRSTPAKQYSGLVSKHNVYYYTDSDGAKMGAYDAATGKLYVAKDAPDGLKREIDQHEFYHNLINTLEIPIKGTTEEGSIEIEEETIDALIARNKGETLDEYGNSLLSVFDAELESALNDYTVLYGITEDSVDDLIDEVKRTDGLDNLRTYELTYAVLGDEITTSVEYADFHIRDAEGNIIGETEVLKQLIADNAKFMEAEAREAEVTDEPIVVSTPTAKLSVAIDTFSKRVDVVDVTADGDYDIKQFSDEFIGNNIDMLEKSCSGCVVSFSEEFCSECSFLSDQKAVDSVGISTVRNNMVTSGGRIINIYRNNNVFWWEFVEQELIEQFGSDDSEKVRDAFDIIIEAGKSNPTFIRGLLSEAMNSYDENIARYAEYALSKIPETSALSSFAAQDVPINNLISPAQLESIFNSHSLGEGNEGKVAFIPKDADVNIDKGLLEDGLILKAFTIDTSGIFKDLFLKPSEQATMLNKINKFDSVSAPHIYYYSDIDRYYVADFVEGINLKDELKNVKAANDNERYVSIKNLLSKAILELSKNKIYIRDLKNNLIISGDELFVVDSGAAEIWAKESDVYEAYSNDFTDVIIIA